MRARLARLRKTALSWRAPASKSAVPGASVRSQ